VTTHLAKHGAVADVYPRMTLTLWPDQTSLPMVSA